MLNKTGSEGAREQGNKKTGKCIARQQGLVQQQVVILSEVEGSVVAFEDAGSLKERTSRK